MCRYILCHMPCLLWKAAQVSNEIITLRRMLCGTGMARGRFHEQDYLISGRVCDCEAARGQYAWRHLLEGSGGAMAWAGRRFKGTPLPSPLWWTRRPLQTQVCFLIAFLCLHQGPPWAKTEGNISSLFTIIVWEAENRLLHGWSWAVRTSVAQFSFLVTVLYVALFSSYTSAE